MKRISFVILFIGVIAAVVYLGVDRFVGWQYIQKNFAHETATIQLGEATFKVEVASSEEDLIKGLSMRSHLPQGYGMLFELPKKELAPSFWMKDMQFPLDIIWINNGEVVGIEENVPYPKTDEEPEAVSFQGFVSDVLEVNSGDSEGIRVGDSVSIRY